MNLKKIIKEELDGLDWVRNVIPHVPITDLSPGEKYTFHHLPKKSLNSIYSDSDLEDHDLVNTIFIIDESGGFYDEDEGVTADYADANTTDFWLIPAGVSVSGGWVESDGVMVIRVD